MANQWLRLWHDMPTDPKWRTIARASGQRIGDVMAVYMHLLVCASNATERGRTQSFNCEDVASALDIQTAEVEAIFAAMQGRVLDGDRLAGWEKRQVAKEDGAAERAKAWREAKKGQKQAPPNATERTSNATERKRSADKDTEEIKIKIKKGAKAPNGAFAPPEWVPPEPWAEFVRMRRAMRNVPFTDAAAKGVVLELEKLTSAGNDAATLLQNAVTNGWRTVYPPKAGPVRGNAQESLEAANREQGRKFVESFNAAN